ncbi:hypothetical protein [Chondrinema litorale]|uniref:hypothetical protein n=1 Tax=Chondrinema litorale TaxID=2994555 RepID=UPI0025433446|nr:hypothetical protein [Chondrinema litorale]UZR97204.1 hypothetical protein OQ292_25225 [Chondrinema litorale]
MNDLKRVILETVTWVRKVNPDFEKNYYRSDELKPLSCKGYLDLPKEEFYKLIAKRSNYLHENKIELLTESEVVELGSLIWSDPEDSVYDGGAEFYAQGLYDVSECPPWDTWIAKGKDFAAFNHLGNAILSWLPKEHFNKFYSGKAISIMDNMDWILKLGRVNPFLQTIIGKPENLIFEEPPIKWNTDKLVDINNDRWA